MVKQLIKQEPTTFQAQTKLIKKSSLDRQSDFCIQEKKEIDKEENEKHKSRIYGVFNKKTNTFYYIDIHEYLSLKKHISGPKHFAKKGLEEDKTFTASDADKSYQSKLANLFQEGSSTY